MSGDIEIIILSSDEELEPQKPVRKHQTILPYKSKHRKNVTNTQDPVIIISDDILPASSSPENINLPQKIDQIVQDPKLEVFVDSLLDETENVTLEVKQNDQRTSIDSKHVFEIFDNDVKEQIFEITNDTDIRSVLTVLDTNKTQIITEKVNKNADPEVPYITIRFWNCLQNYIYDKKIIEWEKREKLQELKIMEVMNSEVLQQYPKTVFKYNFSEFSIVQIKGMVTEINNNVGSKCGILIDDTTNVIRVIIDNSFEEIKYRDKIKNNIRKAYHTKTLNVSEMDELTEMSDEDFRRSMTLERENQLLTTLSLSLDLDTQRKNETQYPLVQDLELGDTVTIVGRLVQYNKEKFIYAFNLKRELHISEYLKMCRKIDKKL